jgi:hypothetical protein
VGLGGVSYEGGSTSGEPDKIFPDFSYFNIARFPFIFPVDFPAHVPSRYGIGRILKILKLINY